MNESCRDCVNFEDRRCIDKVALCAMHHGPSISCAEFKPKNESIDENDSYHRFCVDCVHFENILGFSICTRAHRPGIACPAFRKISDVKLPA